MTSQGLFDIEIDEEHKIINDPYIFEKITDELEEFIKKASSMRSKLMQRMVFLILWMT